MGISTNGVEGEEQQQEGEEGGDQNGGGGQEEGGQHGGGEGDQMAVEEAGADLGGGFVGLQPPQNIQNQKIIFNF